MKPLNPVYISKDYRVFLHVLRAFQVSHLCMWARWQRLVALLTFQTRPVPVLPQRRHPLSCQTHQNTKLMTTALNFHTTKRATCSLRRRCECSQGRTWTGDCWVSWWVSKTKVWAHSVVNFGSVSDQDHIFADNFENIVWVWCSRVNEDRVSLRNLSSSSSCLVKTLDKAHLYLLGWSAQTSIRRTVKVGRNPTQQSGVSGLLMEEMAKS